MIKDYYVILTGGKNNAGDFLIKYRAKQLFQLLKPDRDIIDFNAWEEFDDERLKIVNNAKMLILMGGPALQSNMYPGIYKLRKNLDDIKVPIVMMGIGWKSVTGEWKDTYNYQLNDSSLSLLKKIDTSGFLSSVRDYHTLNSLRNYQFKNILMTGCPAYYDNEKIGTYIKINKIKKVAFSLGVSFIESNSMLNLMKENILTLKSRFKNENFEVVFHHSLDKDKLLKHKSGNLKHSLKHNDFAKWLIQNDISYIDISGSAENLINYYSNIDLHIGYRVHAHIFMNSISKFSILISEDGRAKGVRGVIGGIVLDGFTSFNSSFLSKILNKLFDKYDRYSANKYLTLELIDELDYELATNYNRLVNSRQIIDNNFNVMNQFIKQLA